LNIQHPKDIPAFANRLYEKRDFGVDQRDYSCFFNSIIGNNSVGLWRIKADG